MPQLVFIFCPGAWAPLTNDKSRFGSLKISRRLKRHNVLDSENHRMFGHSALQADIQMELMESPTFFSFLRISDVKSELISESPNIFALSHTARLWKRITRSHLGRSAEGQFWVQKENLLNKRHGPNKMEDRPRPRRNK